MNDCTWFVGDKQIFVNVFLIIKIEDSTRSAAEYASKVSRILVKLQM